MHTILLAWLLFQSAIQAGAETGKYTALSSLGRNSFGPSGHVSQQRRRQKRSKKETASYPTYTLFDIGSTQSEGKEFSGDRNIVMIEHQMRRHLFTDDSDGDDDNNNSDSADDDDSDFESGEEEQSGDDSDSVMLGMDEEGAGTFVLPPILPRGGGDDDNDNENDIDSDYVGEGEGVTTAVKIGPPSDDDNGDNTNDNDNVDDDSDEDVQESSPDKEERSENSNSNSISELKKLWRNLIVTAKSDQYAENSKEILAAVQQQINENSSIALNSINIENYRNLPLSTVLSQFPLLLRANGTDSGSFHRQLESQLQDPLAVGQRALWLDQEFALVLKGDLFHSTIMVTFPYA